jgi:hypothetical protein
MSKMHLITAGCIMLATLGSGAYVLAIRNNPPTSLRTSPTPLPNSEQTDLIANWKTYTNSIYGYSIRYPSDFSIINPIDNTYDIASTPHSIKVGTSNAEGVNWPFFYINVIPPAGLLPGTYNNDGLMQNLLEYINSIKVGDVIKAKNMPFNIEFIRRDNMRINGYIAYVFESTSYYERRIIIQQNGITYVIGGYFNPDKPGDDKQFYQILSTFHVI